ncbi:MAG: copper oxidase [Chloroflexota bacterium]
MTTAFSFTRRKFLAAAGVVGLGVGLAACDTAPTPAPTPMAGMDASSTQGTNADDMDAMHEKGVKDFVAGIEANSKTFWPQRMPFKMEGDVKVFGITCTEVSWQTRPGENVNAFAYNGVVPGQEIRVTEGDKVRVVVNNELKESTTIHWHGVHTPNAMDGVPFITQPPIKPGQSFTYAFVAKPAGSHMYHSHHNAAEQVTKGLLGAFVIEPKDKSKEPKYDSDYTMILNDTNVGLTINGKSFPATAPILAKVGEKVRIRLMNEGLIIHPMHLHGMYMNVVAKDGALLSAPYLCDTLNLAPGERYDVIADCQEPGVWPFHCHILTHAESPRGMFGMVTALIVNA